MLIINLERGGACLWFSRDGCQAGLASLSCLGMASLGIPGAHTLAATVTIMVQETEAGGILPRTAPEILPSTAQIQSYPNPIITATRAMSCCCQRDKSQ